MLDYKLLNALAAVLEHQGFERAARALGLTQSAVSQRVKLLEARLGQPVLIRGTPPTPTGLGRRLLNHVQQVRLLEAELIEEAPSLTVGYRQLRIAINADSLATWWPQAVGDYLKHQAITLDLVIEDQDVGLERMRKGEVAACLCASDTPVQGARVISLGAMRYRALASPDFLARHCPQGATAEALQHCPAIIFGPNDQLQHRFLDAQGVTGPFPHHRCASVEGFIGLAKAGLGFGLVPDIQARRELAEGTLVDVVDGWHLDVPLFWHFWRHGGDPLERLGHQLAQAADHHLIPLT
ncbi:LysR family transcriptional regulator ArgP [Halomonas denitrificans]|uniref:LysR family transcriptional regulator ArgP n=1 Tax=Halomonas denitrificans TaxID=370769 RepID=UPI001C995187|nr:LysR family transcriptional regulator ArgP [Halomonas denitrificans]MBY5968942.1 LysR family transcriptional regulator ArgP [Halomonas denitrificans]